MWFNQYWGAMPIENLSSKKMAKMQNNAEFLDRFEYLWSLAMNIFKWENLPETCDGRFLERSFLLYGKALFAKVDGAYLTLAGANGAGLNVYGYPVKGWGYGLNGFNRQFNLYIPGADDAKTLRIGSDGYQVGEPTAVMGYDNISAYPYISYIYNAARRLSDLMRACDVTVQNLKSPMIIRVDEAQVNSIKTVLQQRGENIAAIIGSKSLDLDNFKVFPIEITPETLKTFWEQYRNIESQVLETLGINANDNTDKRERLLVDEINANNETISVNLAKRLKQRELFCERVNKAFGLDIRVKLSEEVEPREEDEADDLRGVRDDDAPSDDLRGVTD